MSIQVSKSSQLTQAFVLGLDDIKKLSELLSSRDETCSFEISCKDGLSREYITVKELLDYENPPKKEIRSLSITAKSKDLKNYHFVRLKFRNSNQDNIEIYLDGPDEIISKLNDGLEDFYPRLKPWYGRLATSDYINMAFYLLVFSVAAIFIGAAAGLFTEKQPSDPAQKSSIENIRVSLAVISIPMALFGIGYLLNRIRDRYFPTAVFAIGQGISRNARSEKAREYIMGAIVTPPVLALLSYLGTWLYRIFSS